MLELEDDVAHVILGGKWRMPTDDEWAELLNNCTRTWTDNYNGTGVKGRIVTSNIEGYKDKSIFLPLLASGTAPPLAVLGGPQVTIGLHLLILNIRKMRGASYSLSMRSIWVPTGVMTANLSVPFQNNQIHNSWAKPTDTAVRPTRW